MKPESRNRIAVLSPALQVTAVASFQGGIITVPQKGIGRRG